MTSPIIDEVTSKASQHILEICKRLHAKNLLAAADGNVSFRINENQILITPSGVSKAFMSLHQMAIVNMNNEVLQGNPSSERLMHLEIYRSCPKAKAVIHAHPPTAIAWSIAHPEDKKLPSEYLSEVILATGDIPFAKYARPGTQDMAKVLKPFLPSHRAIILRNHGAVTWGEDLEEAYRGMERIEHSAHILMLAKQIGGMNQLPSEEINFLYELRKKIGETLL